MIRQHQICAGHEAIIITQDSQDVWLQGLSQRQVFSWEAAPSAPKLQGQQMLHTRKTRQLCTALRSPGVPGLLAGAPVSVHPGSSVCKPLWLLRGCHNAANQPVTESPDCTISLRELECRKDGAF